MIILQKNDPEFKVLNLTDPQLSDEEWTNPDHSRNRDIFKKTVLQLVERIQPGLITISGDLAWAGHDQAYRCLADFMDSLSIPWAPVWGNHDNQGGPDAVNRVADEYLTRKHCLYEKGDPTLGNGNYVIGIEENGQIVAALIMMDSHDRAPYVDSDGKETNAWAKLIPEQLAWYREQIEALRAQGCEDTAIILHIPIYAYRTAFRAALRDDVAADSDTAKLGVGWNDPYRDSIGICLENIASYPADEGMFDLIRELGSTRHVVCGHDHINNTIIDYQGVKLVYSLKTGPGCYWTPVLNGGTVLTVTSGGFTGVRHEFVNQQ